MPTDAYRDHPARDPIMNFYYCFICKKLFKDSSNICRRCGRGAAPAERKLRRSTPRLDIYQIYVSDKLVGNQRVEKK